MKRAVITGASGMIGLALIRTLLKEEVEVLAVVRPGSLFNKRIPINEKISIVECEISHLSDLPKKINVCCDAFFHLAWGGTYGDSRNNLYGQLENVKYTLTAVEAAEKLGCSVFLGAGSQAEFGRVTDQTKLSDRIPTHPDNGYGIAKLCAGQMSRAMCKEFHIRHVWTRILSVYGPCDKPHTMVMSGIISMLKGDRPKYTKGEQMWDYLYCDDAARALYLAAEKGRDGGIYCIGSGEVRPMREYIRTIRDITNPKMELLFGEIPYYDHQVMYLCADMADLKKDTGFCHMVTFEEGIRRTVSWCREQKEMGLL